MLELWRSVELSDAGYVDPYTASLAQRLRMDLLAELLHKFGPGKCPAGGAGGGGYSDLFGDGSDGDVVLRANSTLVRDMFYNSLRVVAGVTLDPNGFAVYVRKELLIEAGAKIASNGSAGGNASGATGGAAGTAGGATAQRPWVAISGTGGVGGTSGGAGTTAGAGGAAGTGVTRVQNAGPALLLAGAGGGGGGYLGASGGATNAAAGAGSLGADGGAGGAAVFSAGTPSLGGGGGGGGGGVVVVNARFVQKDGNLEAKGGAGGNGQTSSGNKSGNGGGGAGGAVVLTCWTFSGAGSLSAAAGAAGTGGNGGAAGAVGTTMTVVVKG